MSQTVNAILAVVGIMEAVFVLAIVVTTTHMRIELKRRGVTADKHVDFAIKVRRLSYWLGTMLATATAVSLVQAWQGWAPVHITVTVLGVFGLFAAFFVSRAMQRTIEHRWTSELAEYLATLINGPEAHVQRFSMAELMAELSGTMSEAKRLWLKNTMTTLVRHRSVEEHQSPLGTKWEVNPAQMQQVMRELHRIDATR